LLWSILNEWLIALPSSNNECVCILYHYLEQVM
jgi:hypothetical protein